MNKLDVELLRDLYINADGFVTIMPKAPPVPGEGNGWLQTGLAYACGIGFSLADTEDRMAKCRVSNACPLLWRSPWKKLIGDENEHDDIFGAALLSKRWAQELLEWAEKHGWMFDPLLTDHPDYVRIARLRYRFDRIMHFPPFLRAAAGQQLSLMEQAVLAATIALGTIKNADRNMMMFCAITASKEQESWLLALARWWWGKRIRKMYGTIGQSWYGYFKHEHPLVAFDQEGA